jgi:hypothetical protein
MPSATHAHTHLPGATQSPASQLQAHATARPAEQAVLGTTAGSTASLTWSELRRRALDAGAGMTTGGVRPGDVVLILMTAGVRAVEVELAVRAVAAVPVFVPEQMGAHEVATLLDGVDVRLVVVDVPRRLGQLRLCDHDAPVLECDDESWGRLRAVGAHQLLEQPHLITLANAAVPAADTATVVGVSRDKSAPWLVRPAADGANDELRPGDVVLLVGAASDRLATVVRRALLVHGCTLAWIEDAEDLGATLAVVRPTHLFLDGSTSKALEQVLVDARINGDAWHATPVDVLDAAAAQAGEARLKGRTRKLAAAVTDLAPWFGGRLRQIVLDTRVDRTVLGLAAGLDLQIGRVAHHPARQAALTSSVERGTAVPGTGPVAAPVAAPPVSRPTPVQQSLAQRAAARLKAAQQADLPASQPAVQPAAAAAAVPAVGVPSRKDPAEGLPTRARGGRDSAFSLLTDD